jgi:hypothetical protein
MRIAITILIDMTAIQCSTAFGDGAADVSLKR